MQFTFGDKREVYLHDKSALSVTRKESMREGKKRNGPKMKYGHTNLNSICAQTNKRVCVFNLREKDIKQTKRYKYGKYISRLALMPCGIK